MGYCMGGTLAAGLAARAPDGISALATIGAPWDFASTRGVAGGLRAMIRAQGPERVARQIDALGRAFGLAPVPVFQTLFALVNPMQAAIKFQKLARLDPASAAARHFVALEDWLADGIPMAAPAARDLLIDWQIRNLTASARLALPRRPGRSGRDPHADAGLLRPGGLDRAAGARLRPARGDPRRADAPAPHRPCRHGGRQRRPGAGLAADGRIPARPCRLRAPFTCATTAPWRRARDSARRSARRDRARIAGLQEGNHDGHRNRIGRAHRRWAASTAPSPPRRRTSSARPPSRPSWSARASTRRTSRETILGQVLTAGQGQNPARQAHIHAGLPMESAAWGINQVCGSGLRAVALGAQHIQLGDAEIVVAGGQESMSLSPHAAHLRVGPEDGRHEVHRHDGEGRPLGRLQQLPHGHDRRKRRHRVADHPRTAGRIRRRQPEQGRSRAEGRQVRRGDRRLHRQDPQGRRDRRQGRIHPPRRDDRRDGQAPPRLLQGRHRHRRQRLRPQRRRRGRRC